MLTRLFQVYTPPDWNKKNCLPPLCMNLLQLLH
ncbi:hypothetical protein P3X46_014052 [Hevea brasiliensis]|uniref:Uncharacterized protein n=1 Tax=Hevea brasiliensis TaxID=3981 RepID=A0ABQ9M6I5_HEVBR|nr:hypothetical protein P3X46_014052 [Hevea brasiliensis]